MAGPMKAAGVTTVSIDDNGSVARDLTAWITDIPDIGEVFEELDATGISDTANQVVAGIQALQEITFVGNWDDTATSGVDATLRDAAGEIRTVLISIKSGTLSFGGDWLCTAYKVNVTAKGLIKFSVTFSTDNGVTVGTS